MILTAEDLRLHLVSRILSHDPARPLLSEMDLVIETISQRFRVVENLRWDLLQYPCGVNLPRQRRQEWVVVGNNVYIIPLLPGRKGRPKWMRSSKTVLYHPKLKMEMDWLFTQMALRQDLDPLPSEERLSHAARLIFRFDSVISQLQTSRMVRNARAAAF